MKKPLYTLINLPWHKKSAEHWFAPLSKLPWSMLLHSGYANNHSHSRFDILVADPIGTLITFNKITRVTLKNTFISREDPFLLLEKALNACGFYAENNPDLPFQGGALGLFGYDLGYRLTKLPKKRALLDINIPDMAIGLYDWALIVDHYKRKLSLLSYSDINFRLKWLQEAQKKPMKTIDFHLTSSWCTNISYKEYAIKFDQIQNYLRNGDCYQVNLARRFQASYSGDEWQAFVYLNDKNRAPFSAFLNLNEGVLLSFSPERFIQLSNGNIQTRPIKGTVPRLFSPKADAQQMNRLRKSSKNRAENLMIVDLMRNDIGRVAKHGSVQVPEIFKVETFSSVHHLVSTITACLSSSYSACDLLRAVFPGGSITGAPKIKAMEIIDELEPHCRNAWCGNIGYLSVCGNMDTNITIRTIIAYNNQLYCSAGGGIVIDSRLQIEYQEIFDKVNSILEPLKMVTF